MKNWYYELFQYLYDHYDISGGPSLDNFVKPRIRKSQKLVDIRHIKDMLDNLEKRSIITWKADILTTNQDGIHSYHWLDIPKYKDELGKDDSHTFDNIRVEAHLTPDVGLEYVASILNREGTALTNKRIRDLTIVLVIIGVVTILIQGLQCDLSRRQLKQSEQAELPSTSKIKDTSHVIIFSSRDSLKPISDNSAKKKQDDTTAFKHNSVDKTHKTKKQ